MADLDFAGLRADIEAATLLPEFSQVTKRSRRRKARNRLAMLGTVTMIMMILGPAGAFATLHRPTGPTNVSRPNVFSTVPAGPQLSATPDGHPSTAGTTVRVVAAAGVDLDHVYALVNVCVTTICDLELTRVTSGSAPPAPVRTGLLHTSATEVLESASLQAISRTMLVADMAPVGQPHQYKIINLDDSRDIASPGSASPGTGTADVPVQMDRYGLVKLVNPYSGQFLPLPHQPQMATPTLVTGMPAADGIWVVGTALSSGELAVAASQDLGATWTIRTLGVTVTDNAPVFASYPGEAAYLLVRQDSGTFTLFRSVDHGHSWTLRTSALPWPQPVPPHTPFGMVVRPDGSLLAWLSGSPNTTYLRSDDGGHKFILTAGAPGGGPVYQVTGGYVALGTPPHLSRDGATWTPSSIAYTPPRDSAAGNSG